MRSLFKGFFFSCVPCRKKQIAPKNYPSPTTPSSPKPILSRDLSYESEPGTPVKLARNFSQKNEFAQFIIPMDGKVNGGKLGVKDLKRAASAMEARSYRASAFAGSRTMSSNDIRRIDSSNLMRSTSRSNQPIIFSTSSGILKPQQMEMELECTIDELCFGCIKQIEVSRDVISNGLLYKEEELLTVNVKPGWKKETMITFPGWEDKETGKISGDVIFIVVEKEDEIMKRGNDNEDDLEIEIGLPLVDAIAGCSLSIPLLGEEEMSLTIDEIVEPGFERIIEGKGMPKMKDPSQRGDLKIKFHVEFPKSLTESQRYKIMEILSD